MPLIKISLNFIDHDSKASLILDLMRFLSAMIVFLYHFYVPLPGYPAVMVFFILSGYFISSTILKCIIYDKWTWRKYLLKRITRLWIVLFPCLMLTFVWASMQMLFFGSNEQIVLTLNFLTFIGNLFFLQGIVVNNYGLNGPLWSLSYEFWYYMLFPLLVLTFAANRKIPKFLYVILFIIISLFVGQRIMVYFLIWLLGALIPLIKPLKLDNKIIRYLLLLFTGSIAILSTQYERTNWDVSWSNFVPDLLVGLSFAFLIYLIISFFNSKAKSSYMNIPKQLAGFSFTLYLAHYPLANFIFTWLNSTYWPFKETPLSIKIMFAIGILIYTWLLAQITEKNTDKVNVWLAKRFFKRSHERITIYNKSNNVG